MAEKYLKMLWNDKKILKRQKNGNKKFKNAIEWQKIGFFSFSVFLNIYRFMRFMRLSVFFWEKTMTTLIQMCIRSSFYFHSSSNLVFIHHPHPPPICLLPPLIDPHSLASNKRSHFLHMWFIIYTGYVCFCCLYMFINSNPFSQPTCCRPANQLVCTTRQTDRRLAAVCDHTHTDHPPTSNCVADMCCRCCLFAPL